MERMKSDPRSISLSSNLYHLLLAVYPTAFRQEYGSLMAQVFTDHAREMVARSGAAGLLTWWVRTLFDMLATAIEQHSQIGVDMSKEKFIKLSGWGMALGSLLLILGLWASSRPEYLEYDIYRNPIDRYLNVLDVPLAVIGLLLISLGLLGMLLRYGKTAGLAGRSFLVLGALSGLTSAIGAVGMNIIVDSDPWWSMFLLGLLVMMLCVALFGVVCLQRRPLPRWNGLPLLAGIGLPFIALFSLGLASVPEIPNVVFNIVMIASFICLGVLGYLVQADYRYPAPAGQSI